MLLCGPFLALLLCVTPAAAHVEVSGQPAQAGATDAAVTFNAESESPTAGITRLEILADPAIGPADVTLVEGPAGWQVVASSSGGFAVEGPSLAPGQDAKVSIRVKRLPDAPEVVFKVLQSYSDGQVDRWIGLPGADGEEPASPAPILALAPAAPAPSPSVAPSSTTQGDTQHDGDAETGRTIPALAVTVAVALAVAVALGIRSRKRNANEAGPTDVGSDQGTT